MSKPNNVVFIWEVWPNGGCKVIEQDQPTGEHYSLESNSQMIDANIKSHGWNGSFGRNS